MELRKDYADKYCECCGKKNIDIWNQLQQQPIDDKGNRVWEGHKQYANTDYFYSGSTHLEYCTDCGEKLDDEDIRTASESRGEFWGAPCSETIVVGFECSSCGYKETF